MYPKDGVEAGSPGLIGDAVRMKILLQGKEKRGSSIQDLPHEVLIGVWEAEALELDDKQVPGKERLALKLPTCLSILFPSLPNSLANKQHQSWKLASTQLPRTGQTPPPLSKKTLLLLIGLVCCFKQVTAFGKVSAAPEAGSTGRG